MNAPVISTPDWAGALLAGDRLALARAITAVENETRDARAILALIADRLGRARVVGFTGAPGAGKSTLVGAFCAELRRRGLTVGIVAVDPSSPLTGGAILGDRIRMTRHAGDDGVFVRSLASRGHLGGLSRTAQRVVDVLDAAGKDVVLVETVGTGQSEVEIADIADCCVVVTAPGLGDEIQAIKAGILEIADVLVVNKADNPLADRTARQLGHSAGIRNVPVVKTIAVSEQGIDGLADAVLGATTRRGPDATARRARRLARLVRGLALDRLRRALDRIDAESVVAANPDLDQAAGALVEHLLPHLAAGRF